MEMHSQGNSSDKKVIAKKIETFEQDAHSYDKSGETEKALKAYKKILGHFIQNQNTKKISETLIEMGELYKTQGEDTKAIQHLNQALDIVNKHSPTSVVKGTIYFNIARVYHDEGNLEKAIEYWKYAIPIYESHNRAFEVAMANRYIGFSYRDLDDEDTAIRYFQMSLPYFKTLENTLYAANTSNALGYAFQAQGKFELALDYFEQALDLYNRSDNPFDHLSTLMSISICFNKLGETDKAIAVYLRGLLLMVQNPSNTEEVNINKLPNDFLNSVKLQEILEQRRIDYQNRISRASEPSAYIKYQLKLASVLRILGNIDATIDIYNSLLANEVTIAHDQQAQIYHNLGLLYQFKEKYDNSLNAFMKSQELYKKLGNMNGAFYSLIGISDVYVKLGKPDDALNMLKQTLDLFTDRSGALIKATIYNALGTIYKSKGLLDKALGMYHKCLDLIERTANPLEEAIALSNLGETYYLMKQYNEAKDKYQRALKMYDLVLPSKEKAKTLTGLGNVYNNTGLQHKAYDLYHQALQIQDDYSIDTTYTLNNLTDYYLDRKKYNKAVECAMQSLNISEQTPNPYLKAIPLKKLGNIFYEKDEKEKAFEFCAQAVEIYSKSPNPNDIKKPLDIIYHHDPERALDLGLHSALGCNWILTKYQKQIAEGNISDPSIWKYMKLASSTIWYKAQRRKELGTFEGSIFTHNWKLQHYIKASNRRISPETTFNYLFGANDLSLEGTNSFDSFHNSLSYLAPMWFVEIPPCIDHGQQYLPIRLNNLVVSMDDFVSYPNITNSNPPIKRVKLKLETQWLQKFEIDHLFYPNTDEEYQTYQQNPDLTWLSDMIVMDLGAHTKRVEAVELTYNQEIYLEDDSETPDFISTTNTLTIPVIRRRNYQKLERIKENHNNFLAILLATWSIILSLATYLLDADFQGISGFLNQNPGTILISVSVIFGVFALIGVWLRRKINSDPISVGYNPSYESNTIGFYDLD